MSLYEGISGMSIGIPSSDIPGYNSGTSSMPVSMTDIKDSLFLSGTSPSEFPESSFSMPELSSASDTSSADDFMSYLSGLLTSVGDENRLNRIFNDEQARLNREYNSLEAEKSRVFNSQEAEKARKWSEDMSNTSFQRAVLDLQKAGLNPILAYQQGASTPSPSSASSSSASGQNASYNVSGGDSLSDLIQSLGSFFSSATDIFANLSDLLKA